MLIAESRGGHKNTFFLRLIDRCFTSEVCTLFCSSSDLHMQERERESCFTVSSSEALSFYLRRRRWELNRQQRVL